MTYCLAVSLGVGLVFAGDSRTTAGVDQVSTYRKLHTFEWPGERVFTLLSAGNLATTQAVVKRLELDASDSGADTSLRLVPHLSAAAEYVGSVSSDVQNRQGGMSQQSRKFNSPFADFQRVAASLVNLGNQRRRISRRRQRRARRAA